jgi:hypothetical protein
MVVDILVSIVLVVMFFFNIAFICIVKEKLEKIDTHLNNENKELTPETDEKEETLEEQAVNVFNFVDDVLDGKKELEDFYNEEQQDI